MSMKLEKKASKALRMKKYYGKFRNLEKKLYL